jgi:hypothetical protein
MFKLNVKKFGEIDEERLGSTINTVDECYRHLEPRPVILLDLYFFQKASTMRAFLYRERKDIGVTTSSFDERFFATHDAWQGIPRIMLCQENMQLLPELVNAGGIRHEVAHTVLHGSPEYYVITVPEVLREACLRYAVPSESVTDLLYLMSIAVKDYEATRLLYGRGYIEDQVAYNSYFLKPTEEDIQVWQVAQLDPLAKVVAIAALLKNFCSATPLVEDEKYGENVRETVEAGMSHISPQLSSGILRTLMKVTRCFSNDTHRNITLLTQSFVEEFIDMLLGQKTELVNVDYKQ